MLSGELCEISEEGTVQNMYVLLKSIGSFQKATEESGNSGCLWGRE